MAVGKRSKACSSGVGVAAQDYYVPLGKRFAIVASGRAPVEESDVAARLERCE